MTTLYLVRHGQVENNIKRLLNGAHEDQPLNEMGLSQVATLAEPFAAIAPDVIYTSPMLRAKQTAMALRGTQEIPIIEDARLCEMDHGDWEGKPLSQLAELFGKNYYEWKNMLHPAYASQGAEENVQQMADRMEQAMLDAVCANRGKRIVFTAHGGIIRMAVIRLFGGSVCGFSRYPYLPNASLTAFEIGDDGRVRLQQMGSTAHIPPELITAPTGRVPDWMWREHIWQALKGKQNGNG